MARLHASDRSALLQMEDRLRERVVGQDGALSSVADAVRLSRAGLHAHTRPVGSFLFLGPTGVGKTELCKAVSEHLFDSERKPPRYRCRLGCILAIWVAFFSRSQRYRC